MKKFNLLIFIAFFFLNLSYAQLFTGCENVTAFSKSSRPGIGIVISSGDTETVWNALRLGIAAQSKGDTVVIFVISKAVDVFIKDSSGFDIPKTCNQFISKGGEIYTCATCASMRHTDNVKMCTITSINDLYAIIKQSKIVVSF